MADLERRLATLTTALPNIICEAMEEYASEMDVFEQSSDHTRDSMMVAARKVEILRKALADAEAPQ